MSSSLPIYYNFSLLTMTRENSLHIEVYKEKYPRSTKAKVVVSADFLPSAQVVVKNRTVLRTEKSPEFRKSTPWKQNIKQEKFSKEQTLHGKQIHTWCYHKPNYIDTSPCNASNPIYNFTAANICILQFHTAFRHQLRITFNIMEKSFLQNQGELAVFAT